jgi:hypothetical protein
MDVNTTILKIKQRLNKLDSSDYDNIQCWQIREAINKAQLEWIRRQVHGVNLTKEGDEETRMRVDDLQPLLVQTKGTVKFNPFYLSIREVFVNC